MLFQTFSPWCLQFSSLVCCKHGGGFDFQLIFVAFTNGFQKIVVFCLQTDTCARISNVSLR
jgi:hypothetical protein